jgi:hypothetical protein
MTEIEGQSDSAPAIPPPLEAPKLSLVHARPDAALVVAPLPGCCLPGNPNGPNLVGVQFKTTPKAIVGGEIFAVCGVAVVNDVTIAAALVVVLPGGGFPQPELSGQATIVFPPRVVIPKRYLAKLNHPLQMTRMNELFLESTVEAPGTFRSATPATVLHLAKSKRPCNGEGLHYRPRARRHICRSTRAVLAALRAAEQADWQATGGDFLAGMHQPFY